MIIFEGDFVQLDTHHTTQKDRQMLIDREMKDGLWEELIKQIRTDIADGDCSALYGLLSFLPDDTLSGYLDEEI